MLIRVVNLVTTYQQVGIIAEMLDVYSHLSLIGDLWNQKVCTLSENKPNLGSDCRVPVQKPPPKPSGSGM